MTPEAEEKRKKILDNYQGVINPSITRTMIAYDRYFEADNIIDKLGEEIKKGLKILDFGCGVGDYGIKMAKAGGKVTFYDFQEFIDFVKYRVELENLDCKYIAVGNSISDVENFDFIIFGEVLEHLQNPLFVLSLCIKKKITYLFTSSYPYITDSNQFKKSGHSLEAEKQQKEFREKLENVYNKIGYFGGGLNLWKIK